MIRKLTARWDQLDACDREAAQLRQLRSFLSKKVLPFSKHYRNLFREIGASPGDLRSWVHWAEVPFTSKADLLPRDDGSSPARDFVLIPDEEKLRSQWEVILRGAVKGRKKVKLELGEEFRPVMMTSTTGRSTEPVPFLYTKHDIRNLFATGERIMLLGESKQDYRHLNMFPYAPHLAFWQTHYSGIGYGAFMVSTGGGKVMGTGGNVALAERVDPDVLIGMPTFIYHVLQVALEKGKRMGNLKTIVLGGEKVPNGMRRKLRAMVRELGGGSVSVISTYGFTEAKMAFPECTVPEDAERGSGFHVYPDLALIEVVDPETGEVLGENQKGEIVFSSLDSRGSVVLRYRTGDVIEHGLSSEKCEFCGRTLPRLRGKISRVSEVREVNLGKVKGTLVNFNELEHILDEFESIGSWQIELRKRNDDPFQCDELLVHVNCREEVDKDNLSRDIENRFVRVAEIKPNEIRFHSAGELRSLQGVGRELKEQRFVDNRARP